MYNGVKENKQRMLNCMCEAIKEMRANGSEEHNHIIALRFFTREKEEVTRYKVFPKGDYVRIVWSNNPERDDGYYDVYVDGDSCYGMFEDVWNAVKHCIG